jgi:general nucleoside transport system permease protein
MALDWTSLIHDSLNLSIPLILAALGGLVQLRAGIVNIAIEGQMICGALAGFVASATFKSFEAGIVSSIIFGAIFGAFTSFLIINLKGNEILVGLGFNVLIVGAIGYVLKSMLDISGTVSSANVVQIPKFNLVPETAPTFLAVLFNGHDILYWISIAMIALIPFFLSKTRSGLRLRSVGLSPTISTSLGLKVGKIKMLAGVFAGAMAGVAGCELCLGQVGLFNLQMIAGRGFIALAAFYFGRLAPIPTALACLTFAFFDSLQVQLQLMSFSANLVNTLPYAMVIVALAASQFMLKLRSHGSM